MNQRRQLCTFFLEGLFLGVEVERVQEVIRYQEMTRIPLSPPVIAGLINLRGQIVTAIDLRHQLALPARPDDVRPMNVVIRREDGPVSLLVDEIGDVVEVDEQSFEHPPDTLEGRQREFIRGVYKLKEHCCCYWTARRQCRLWARIRPRYKSGSLPDIPKGADMLQTHTLSNPDGHTRQCCPKARETAIDRRRLPTARRFFDLIPAWCGDGPGAHHPGPERDSRQDSRSSEASLRRSQILGPVR